MHSSNPVFSRSAGFNGQPGSAQTGMTYPAYDASAPVYAPDPTQNYGGNGYAAPGRMTIDSVVQKTAITLGLVVLTAAATWAFIGPIFVNNGTAVDDSALALAGGLATGGAILGLVLSLVNSFKRVVSPALVLAFAAVEGVFVGAFSKLITAYVGGDGEIVVQAVIGTFVAFAATLAAYKFFNIQVTERFRRIFSIALFGFVGLLLVNFVLSFFSADLGLRNMGTMGLIVSVVALVFGVISLIMDFDMVERGISYGLDDRESWRAAFGLTVTLVWVYIELLRILAILRGDD